MNELQTLPSDTDTLVLQAALQREGVVVLENLIDQSTVDQINREIDPILAGPALGLTDAKIVSDGRRINSSLRHSPTIANEVAANPVLLDLAGSALLEHCDTLQISATQVAEIAPGEPAQALHRDDYTWGHIKGRSHPISFVMIMALTEFTPESGGTRVIPGSHRWDDAYEASTKKEAWRGGVYAEKAYPKGMHEELVVQPLSPQAVPSLFSATPCTGLVPTRALMSIAAGWSSNIVSAGCVRPTAIICCTRPR